MTLLIPAQSQTVTKNNAFIYLIYYSNIPSRGLTPWSTLPRSDLEADRSGILLYLEQKRGVFFFMEVQLEARRSWEIWFSVFSEQSSFRSYTNWLHLETWIRHSQELLVVQVERMLIVSIVFTWTVSFLLQKGDENVLLRRRLFQTETSAVPKKKKKKKSNRRPPSGK